MKGFLVPFGLGVAIGMLFAPMKGKERELWRV